MPRSHFKSVKDIKIEAGVPNPKPSLIEMFNRKKITGAEEKRTNLNIDMG